MQKKWIALITGLLVLSFLMIVYTAGRNEDALQAGKLNVQESVIILDAGHGGYDGGTTAADGTPEKTLNLEIVRKIDALLQAAGVQTVLTRTDDQSIHDPTITSVRKQKISDIHNRLAIMEQTENSVFVSIHQNYYTKPQYSGTQVFYSGNDPLSKALAQSIQSAVTSSLQPENHRTIKRSGTEIYLLYHAPRPAVMVECGFLSNEEETARLKDDAYQRKLSICIFRGILRFFESTEVV